MGIPAFYRWLVETHPLAVADVIEDYPEYVDGIEIPVDLTGPNPNAVEFDNLYLDMNGIIHPCFHPENLPAPTSYEEVFKAVFKYIDKIFSLIRPRKLLYLAIDGVAPRAKMNHQRSRRFRAAKDAAEEASIEESTKKNKRTKVAKLTRLEQCNKLDSNVITPGTEFMSQLSSALQYYVHLKMNADPGWKNIKVILSDASVPGEGEHKIMSYIRLQRNLPGFDPNTRHCLYGLDADLIMLALASHEILFSILREVSKPPKSNRHNKDASNSPDKGGTSGLNIQELHVKNIEDNILNQKFQFFHVWVLRDYLMHELRIPGPTVKRDLERLIDDFVFMCIFVGNDFLPHIPSLQISEGAIDLMIKVYKNEFVRMGGYLTDSWKVNLERVQYFVQAVGSYENAIFQKRGQVEKQMDMRWSSSHSRSKKTKGSRNNSTSDVGPVLDQIKLDEVGWKERYYAQKFEAKTDDERERIRKHTVLKYVEGICWFMHYYYEGVCSWQWFYPYHYAPFASDLHGLGKLQIEFTLGMPFKPFEQLMAVLPAASAHALPLSYRKLMTDPSSPILDFYPCDFELDMDGKRFSWQAICKLPFIEESRLLSELAKVEHTLTEEEKQRNSLGLDMLFVHKIHPLAGKIFSFCIKSKNHPKLHEAKVKQKINPEVSGGLNGYMYVSDKLVSPPEIESSVDGLPMIMQNEVISVFYKYPSFHSHVPRPPEGVIMPSKSVSKKNVFSPPVLWHEKSSAPGRVTRDRRTTKFVSNRRVAVSAHLLVTMLQTQGCAKDADTKSVNVMDKGGSNEACDICIGVDHVEPLFSVDDVEPMVAYLMNYVYPEGVNLSQAVYEDNGALMQQQCYGYAPPYGPYSPAGSTMGHDGQLYGAQHYPYYPVYQRMNTTHVPNLSLDEMAPVDVEYKSNQNSTALVKEADGAMKESVAIASKKRKPKTGKSKKARDDLMSIDDVAPVPNQNVPNLTLYDMAPVLNLNSTFSQKKRRRGKSKKARDDLMSIDDVAPVPNQNVPNLTFYDMAPVLNLNSTASKKKCKRGKSKKARDDLMSNDDVALVPNQNVANLTLYDMAPVLNLNSIASKKEVNGEGGKSGVSGVSYEACAKDIGVGDATALVKEANGAVKESVAIASEKRKRKRGGSKKALDDLVSIDDVAPMPTQKASMETNKEGKETGVVGLSNEVCATALVKEMNGEAMGEGILCSVVDVASMPNQNPTASADVASVPNQKPTTSVKEVNGKANGEGKLSDVADVASMPNQKPTAYADVASVPNQKPTPLVKEVNKEVSGEEKECGVADMESMPNQNPSTSAKEVNELGIEPGIGKREQGQAKKAQANSACVADVAPIGNQKPMTFDKDITVQ